MRTLLWLIGLFSLAVLLSLAARYNTGYALLVVPPWRIQVSLNLLILAFAFSTFLVYLLVRLVVNTLAMPRKVQAFRVERAKHQSLGHLRDALRLLLEGRYGHAVRSAEKAADQGESPQLMALIAARAAHAMRDPARVQTWLAKAEQEGDPVRAARLMTQMELQCDARRFAEAQETLDSLDKGGQRHIAALRLALKVQQGARQWDEVLRLSRQLEKHKAMTPEQAALIRLSAHQENLHALGLDATQLLAYWENLPSGEKRDSKLALLMVRALSACEDEQTCQLAQEIIEHCLVESWDGLLASHYADCRAGDSRSRIIQAEKWLVAHPQDSGLLLTLGRLCRQQQLWGKAQSYLEASIAIQPSRAAHLELAALLDHLERGESANIHYRAAARL